MRTFVYTLGFLVLAQPVSVTAQDSYLPFGLPAWGWGGGYRHASTYEEGVQRGMADIIRSAGQANLLNSEAAKNYEDARRKYMDNRVYGSEKYFEMRRINREARDAERGPRPTMEDIIRYSNARKPNRASPSELDPVTGAISWPALLRDAQFKDRREKLEQIYAVKASFGFLTGEQLMTIQQLADGMKAELKVNISDYPPQAYVQAKSFLETLVFESQMGPG
jgi:hypothetical protein